MANRLPTGPRSIQARMRSLSNLRNVGKKIFFDKEYSDQLWEDGMDYTTKRRKRQARKQVNQHKGVWVSLRSQSHVSLSRNPYPIQGGTLLLTSPRDIFRVVNLSKIGSHLTQKPIIERRA